MKLACYVISAGRAANVAAMAPLLTGLNATWVVPPDEVDTYAAAGAPAWGVDGALCEARNAALDAAFADGAWCVQLDDDLRKVKRLGSDDAWHPVPAAAAIAALADALASRPYARLAGAAPTDNPYFARGGITREWGFILGSMTVTAPTPLRYDTSLTLKEDWDYTCQHLWHYGGVVRCDSVLPTFLHYSNKGGAQRYRDDRLEAEITARLLDRWPGLLRPHSRRTNELALRRRTLNLASV